MVETQHPAEPMGTLDWADCPSGTRIGRDESVANPLMRPLLVIMGREILGRLPKRALADRLRTQLQLPVHLADERLTSAAADTQMARTGLTHRQKKQRRDSLAAAAILRDFLDKTDPSPT